MKPLRSESASIFFAGLAAAPIALGAVHASWLAPVPYPYLGSYQMFSAIALGLSLAVSAYAVGLPDGPESRGAAIGRTFVAFVVAAVLISVGQLVLGTQLMPRSVLGLVSVTSIPWALIGWNLSNDLNEREVEKSSVFMISERHDDVAALEAELVLSPERSARIVGDARPDGIRAMSTEAFLTHLDERDAAIVVLDAASQLDDNVVRLATQAHLAGHRIRTLSLFYEEWVGKVPIAEIERVTMLSDVGELHRQNYGRARRVVDILLSVAGSAVLGVILPIVLVGNLVGNRGPLFYRQSRVGRGGKPFEILKLRSMVSSGSTEWTSNDDARITTFGSLLRRSHLDELPQVINVLRGELSIVGPRPEQLQYVEELRQKIDFYDSRHIITPGLTGWAQVKFGYASSESDAVEKLEYDLYYLRRQGLALDLRIIIRTLRAVLGRRGR